MSSVGVAPRGWFRHRLTPTSVTPALLPASAGRMVAAMAEISTRRVAANGLSFTVDEMRGRGMRWRMCLHGFPESRFSWRHQLPALAAAGVASGGARPARLWRSATSPRVARLIGWSISWPMSRGCSTRYGAKRRLLIGHDWGGHDRVDLRHPPGPAARRPGDHERSASGHLPPRHRQLRRAAPAGPGTWRPSKSPVLPELAMTVGAGLDDGAAPSPAWRRTRRPSRRRFSTSTATTPSSPAP